MIKKLENILKLDYLIVKKKVNLGFETRKLKKVKTANKKEKNKIYDDVRKQKITNNKLISVDALDITLDSETKKGILEKIPIVNNYFGKKNVDYDYKAFYFGYKNVMKILDIPKIENNTINDTENKELYNLITYEDEKNYFLNGKRILWINRETIFNPKFDVDKQNFLYDLSPKYYYGVINNVMDWNLTKPLAEKTDLMGTIKKYWWVFIVAGVIYYFQNSGTT